MPEAPPADVFALLDDEYARAILRATTDRAMAAPDLVDALDASKPTVYRRIDRLQALDLLAEATELDGDGHHRSVYRARLDRIVVDFDGEFEVRVERDAHPADRFTEMWEDL